MDQYGSLAMTTKKTKGEKMWIEVDACRRRLLLLVAVAPLLFPIASQGLTFAFFDPDIAFWDIGMESPLFAPISV